jgi:hypothetical protein
MLYNKCCWVVYIMIDKGRKGRKPGYIQEMGSHDLKSCEVKCQCNKLKAKFKFCKIINMLKSL